MFTEIFVRVSFKILKFKKNDIKKNRILLNQIVKWYQDKEFKNTNSLKTKN